MKKDNSHIHELPTNNWHKPEDVLPEQCTDVLVSNGYNWHIAYFDGTIWHNAVSDEQVYHVKWWMSIPKLPENISAPYNTLTEDYCPVEISQALKEAGFDWHTNAVWHYDGENYTFIIDYAATFQHPQDIPHWNSPKWGTPHICAAPTLWQAQKWLRDVKRIHVEPRFAYETIYECVLHSQKRQFHKLIPNRYNSYETALCVGITEALQRINNNEDKLFVI